MTKEMVNELIWIITFWFLCMIMHFIHKYLKKKYQAEKDNINKIKINTPKKSVVMRENINNHLFKSYVNGFLLGKWFFLIGSLIIIFKMFF